MTATSVFAGLAQDATAKIGRHSDSGEGVILSKLARGELVKVTPRDNSWTSSTSGTGTVVGSTGTSTSEDNESGLPWSVTLTTPSGFGNSSVARFFFYGRAIGVRFRRDNLEPAIPVNFAVDGRIYPAHDARLRYLNNAPGSQVDGESHVLIDDDIPDLPDGRPHTLDVILPPDNVGSTTYTARIFGLLCERRAGYTEAPRTAWYITTAAVPTTATGIPVANSGDSNDKGFRGVRGVLYVNTTAGPLTVTITQNSTTAYQLVLPALGTDGCSRTFDFLTANSAPWDGKWKHAASGAGVNFTVLGSW